MKFERTEVLNFEGALRGMRNPLESWDKSDSEYKYENVRDSTGTYIIGPNDLALAQKLIKAGTDHSKFMRQIIVCVDITAPLYWWKEFDTYKVGTVANSTSTMHKIASKPITIDCFETDDYNSSLQIADGDSIEIQVNGFIEFLEQLRLKHLHYLKQSQREDISKSERKHFEREAKKYWKELIRWLPESWLQTRTVTMSYQNIRAMRKARKSHKQTEWSISFMRWIESLPYSDDLITFDEEVEE